MFAALLNRLACPADKGSAPPRLPEGGHQVELHARESGDYHFSQGMGPDEGRRSIGSTRGWTHAACSANDPTPCGSIHTIHAEQLSGVL
jgi:hypothetical protein